MYGHCKYGDNCAFAHGIDELNQRKMSSNYKTKLCKQFFEIGYCSYGARCQFSHKKNIENENEGNNEKEEVSYLKILSDLITNNKINQEMLKRPRLMTFETITACSLNESEKNRLLLYEDIINIRKKNNDNIFLENINNNISTNKDNKKTRVRLLRV